MSTLLQLTRLEDGTIQLSGAPCPSSEERREYVDRIAFALSESPWPVQIWCNLLGVASQMLDLGLYQDYWLPDYFEQDGNWDDSADERWETLSLCPAPVVEKKPEMDPEWQKKRMAIRDKLVQWRQEVAARKGLNSWEVIKPTVLEGISRAMPVERKELLDVRGVGELTCARFGEEILEIVQSVVHASADPDADGAGE